MPGGVVVSQENPQVRFEQEGSRLTAIEITREQRSPVIAVLQRTLFALGIVVSSYQARARATRLVERIVIERSDGGSIDARGSTAAQPHGSRPAIEGLPSVGEQLWHDWQVGTQPDVVGAQLGQEPIT